VLCSLEIVVAIVVAAFCKLLLLFDKTLNARIDENGTINNNNEKRKENNNA
jgi:hypothetical protein